MALYHIVILALIQGITEFLPISSSGHLALAHAVMDGDSAGRWGENLTLDVAVHVGTLFSVLVYFRRDIMAMLRGGADSKLLRFVIAASVPVIIAGFALHLFQPDWLRSVEVIAWTTLIFGILLWWVDKSKPAERDLQSMGMKDALLIGLAQILALVPGVSRSGITMSAARWFGFSRVEAARFSLLLAIIAISGAGTLGGIGLVKSGDAALGFDALLAASLAFLSGLGAIALMMRWLERASFAPFALYRVVLGIVLLGIVYGGVLG